MNTKQLKAVENIKRAVDVNDSDTLSMLSADEKVLWTAAGSWQGPENVTLGDLRAIASIVPSEVDYELLLSKYIEHVGAEEGVTFISQFLPKDGHYKGMYCDVKLTPEEYAALKRVAERRGA